MNDYLTPSTADQPVDDAQPTVEQHEIWQDDELLLEPRPRRRFLAPIPVGLLCACLAAVGFVAGVEVQKQQTTGSSAGARFAFGRAASNAGPTAAASRAAGAGLAGGMTIGTVANIAKNVLYVTDTEGNTIAVTVPKGIKASKTVSVSSKQVHPGDSVMIAGSTHGSGVRARSITITTGNKSSQPLFGN